jgi:hypothetical protein
MQRFLLTVDDDYNIDLSGPFASERELTDAARTARIALNNAQRLTIDWASHTVSVSDIDVDDTMSEDEIDAILYGEPADDCGPVTGPDGCTCRDVGPEGLGGIERCPIHGTAL